MTGTVTEIFSLGLRFCVDGAVKAGIGQLPARMGREETRKEPKMTTTLSIGEKASKATEALLQLRREELKYEHTAVVSAIDAYLFDAPTLSRARLYDLVRAS